MYVRMEVFFVKFENKCTVPNFLNMFVCTYYTGKYVRSEEEICSFPTKEFVTWEVIL